MTFSLCRIRTTLFLVPAFALATLSSCRTVPGDIKQTGLSFREASAETGPEENTESTLPDSIELTFAGDIMAHTENWSMSDYSRIYQDVSSLLRNDDLTFANFETPVSNSLPLSTYPRFNVHSSYLDAAVEAGFDVFSLANNHSNDQGLAGVAEPFHHSLRSTVRYIFRAVRREPHYGSVVIIKWIPDCLYRSYRNS